MKRKVQLANYYSKGRTNYFQVKDPEKFKEDMESLVDGSSGYEGISLVEEERGANPDPFFAIIAHDGFWLLFDRVQENYGSGDCAFEDIYSLLQSHLKDEWSITMQEIGWEKMRFLDANITFITKEKTISHSFDSLYKDFINSNEEVVNSTLCQY